MPYGDRTGPNGFGPMTGRGAGYCGGYDVPGYLNPIPGRGYWGRGWGWNRGWGFGRGGGWRWGWAAGYPGWIGRGAYPYYGAALSPQDESKILKEQASALQEELGAVKKRIEELEKQKEEK